MRYLSMIALCLSLFSTENLRGRSFDIPFDPNEKPKYTLSNTEGKSINCLFLDYDFRKSLLKIQRVEDQSKMWVSPSIFDRDSQSTIKQWSMAKAIEEYLVIQASRSNQKNSGKNARYDVTIRNMSPFDLEKISIVYNIYKKAGEHENNEAGAWEFVTGDRRIGTLTSKNDTAEFTTIPMPLNTTVTTTKYIKTIIDTDRKYTTGIERKSSRDSLKGLTIAIYHENQLIFRWYSDRSLQKILESKSF